MHFFIQEGRARAGDCLGEYPGGGGGGEDQEEGKSKKKSSIRQDSAASRLNNLSNFWTADN